MVFSSLVFIFAFLPVVWAVFHILKAMKFKGHFAVAKVFLILASLFFYAYWKLEYLPILLSSIIVNFIIARCVLAFCGQKDSFAFATKLFSPKFYFIIGVIFNLCLLGFFKYVDFFLENFNALNKLLNLDFDIPLPHILLPLALSFVTFQQIAFLFDCYKRTKGELKENLHLNFIDYSLFISFFPQLIAGPIVHHREMMPQFEKMGSKTPLHSHTDEFFHTSKNPDKNSPNSVEILVNSPDNKPHETINWSFLAKGLFIFAIGLFKKTFIADSFAKWADKGFGIVEKGEFLNIFEAWATNLSYTFQLYFDFSGYCDMAMGLGLMFGIVLPLNFNSPYKSLSIAEFWRRWHITLGRFLRECLYIPLGGNKVGKIINLRNLFIVAFLSGIWHGAGWGYVIWGTLHGIAMVSHRIYSYFYKSLDSASFYLKFMQSKIYKVLAWFLTFNFVSLSLVFFRAENVQGALNLFKCMFGVVWVDLPEQYYKIVRLLDRIDGKDSTVGFIVCAFIFCLVFKSSFEKVLEFQPNKKTTIFIAILLCCAFCSLLGFSYAPFIYFNF